ncbi:aldo/keto reductase [Bacillus massilinigeriensis]|uniref:aldo/keto reductase n=1 Tax=Bacillus mediterraneensis TaxID=1805474 RepID=UPI0008F9544F|nr:aldo/keto reductase [Bacillus mediterraneensis]
MSGSIMDKVTLHNGVMMPVFGLGVYKVEEGEETEKTVSSALQLGYRLIDTAAFYDNEEGVGKAIRSSSVPREDIFVTTKVWNSDQGYENTLKAFDRSINKLGVEYVDLYLVHWPVKGKYLDTWRAMEEIYRSGRVRAIGVSNFQVHHLQDILNHCEEKPVINQVELHPALSQEELRAFCTSHEIAVEAWSPIARGRLFGDPIIASIAKDKGKSEAQIILRWHVQNGVIPIPKSVHLERLKENSDICDFVLTAKEMENINSLNRDERFGAHPDHFDF